MTRLRVFVHVNVYLVIALIAAWIHATQPYIHCGIEGKGRSNGRSRVNAGGNTGVVRGAGGWGGGWGGRPGGGWGGGEGGQQYDSIRNLQRTWKPGQRIQCTSDPHHIQPRYVGTLHHMLVYDREYLAHAVERQNRGGHCYVTVHPHTHFAFSTMWQNCINRGFGKYKEKAVARVDEWDRNKPVYFNLGSCDCKHYVDFWVDGNKNGDCPRYLNK